MACTASSRAARMGIRLPLIQNVHPLIIAAQQRDAGVYRLSPAEILPRFILVVGRDVTQ